MCTSEDSSYTTPVLGVLITQVCTSEDSSYPVTGSLFHCQWPPFFVSKAFFSGKIGSLFHEKLAPNIIDKNNVHDRVVGANALPSLATLIRERAQLMALGASWQQGP